MSDDRRPLNFEGRRFLWHPVPPGGSTGEQFDYLPPDVFARLDGFIPRDNPRVSQVVKAYPTREAALDAYRRAAEDNPGDEKRAGKCGRCDGLGLITPSAEDTGTPAMIAGLPPTVCPDCNGSGLDGYGAP